MTAIMLTPFAEGGNIACLYSWKCGKRYSESGRSFANETRIGRDDTVRVEAHPTRGRLMSL